VSPNRFLQATVYAIDGVLIPAMSVDDNDELYPLTILDAIRANPVCDDLAEFVGVSCMQHTCPG
jgi:hypothetical protein